MKHWRPLSAFMLSVTITLNLVPPARACGIDYIEPVFVFKESPDLPFENFTRGNIGIVQPTFGRKALFIAYRYLNDKPFTADEQTALVEALRGTPPEDNGDQAIKTWIAARKELLREDEDLPAIYTERQYENYDFFPNCTRNAFETATETLKDHLAKYGPEDRSVRSWLAAQDVVFENCAGGKKLPAAVGGESSDWLRKDRDYQVAAALFYSLNFDEARDRFEKIAGDTESPWQQTAEYLVGRTLVRQASLIADESRKRATYERAEHYLQKLIARGGQFQKASQKLLALVRYRLRPEDRLRELGQLLAYEGNDQNLRQDLIDYVWLLDRFEGKVLKEEEKRKAELKGENQRESPYQRPNNEKWQAVERGELVLVTFYPKRGDGQPDYAAGVTEFVKPDTPETEVLQTVEEALGRRLAPDEANDIKVLYKSGLERREYLLAPNRKWGRQGPTEYEGQYSTEKLSTELVPEIFHADDLTDWIIAFQISDAGSYARAFTRWRDTQSTPWLVMALAKAEATSPGVDRLVRQAERVSHDTPAFATIAYHLVRLRIAAGKSSEARKLLDEIISSQFDALPISTQNQFLEQRAQLAETLSEFLKYAKRKPVTFSYGGSFGKISDFLENEKGYWTPDGYKETKEDYERQAEESYKPLLPWEHRAMFDEQAADILNRHLPLTALAQAAHDEALPDYLQRRLVLAVWTRAVLLGREDIALKFAEEAMKTSPEMAEAFQRFLNARPGEERELAGLWTMLKFSSLTPFVKDGMPARDENVIGRWADGWWPESTETEYNENGEEVPKVIPKPTFITAAQSQEAQSERETIKNLGPAETYLSNRALEWVKRAPADPRLPEVLYIVTQINLQTRDASGDDDLRERAENLLRTRYPTSAWTAKLDEPRDN